MKPKRRILLGLLTVQVALAAIGAGQVRLPELPNWLGRGLDAYTAASGAANTYSFFAPGVGTELRPTFELIDANGKRTEVGFATDANREVRLRLIKIITSFWDQLDDPKMRRTLSASLAGKVLAQYPEAKSIAFRLDEYSLPEMKFYREGQRPKWNLFYEAKFARRAPARLAREEGRHETAF